MVVGVGIVMSFSLIGSVSLYVVFPLLMIMFIMVVRAIMYFNVWYVGEKKFELLMLNFSILIALYFVICSLGLVVGWEGIGLLSFILISYWGRSHAISASVAAVIYNRFGDLVLLLILINISNPLWFFVAVMAKSATWLGSYWLPIAMESPTPVSSLLHSSTMVVAGIYLASLWSIPVIFTVLNCVGIIVLSLNASLADLKNVIAFSTAVNLALMAQFISLQLWGVVVVHIITHAFINASVFIWSSSLIHSIGVQDITYLSSLYILFGFVLLIALPSIFVGISNEVYMSEALVLTTTLMWLVANYVNNLVHSFLVAECICVLLLPLILILVGSGNIVVMDIPIVVLWLLLATHYVVMSLQR